MNSGLNGLPSHFSKPNNLVGQTLQLLQTQPLSYNSPVIDVTQNWANKNIAFTGIRFNATETADNFSSLLVDLQRGGSSQFTVNEFGSVVTNNNLQAGGSATPTVLIGNSTVSMVGKSTGTFGLTSGALGSGPTAGFSWVASAVLAVGNGAVGDKTGFIQWGGQGRVSTQFDKTSDVTLANVPGLTVTVAAGRTYRFEATLFTTSNVLGGVQAAVAGTCTATNIIYEGEATAAAAIGAQTRATALGTSVAGITAVTAARIDIVGTITVNAGGTLTIQFSQNASTGTASSVLVGSTMLVYDMP